MVSGGASEDETPIGELFGRLVDDGKAYAKAELGLVRATAETKAAAVKKPLALAATALLFVQAGVVVFGVTLALWLATLIGPLGGGLVATLITFAIAGLLFWLAKREFAKNQTERSK